MLSRTMPPVGLLGVAFGHITHALNSRVVCAGIESCCKGTARGQDAVRYNTLDVGPDGEELDLHAVGVRDAS